MQSLPEGLALIVQQGKPMISKVMSSTISGLLPRPVSVEVGTQKGLPKFEVVGLGQSAVKEGRDRILSSIKTVGLKIGSPRIIVNLAPASLKKEGTSLDLPIALGLLSSTGLLDPKVSLSDTVVVGELSLDATIRPVRGAYAIVQELKEQGYKKFILPWENSDIDLNCDPDVSIFPAQNLAQVVRCIEQKNRWPATKRGTQVEDEPVVDWSDVKGQFLAKRALEIAAAGGHHLLLSGSPGVGKTLLAKRFATILPEMCEDEKREVLRIQSLHGRLHGGRPFRSPHHNASITGMLGGGACFRLGEFTLAHQGVLFMDEFPEFRRDVIEALREPLEEGVVRISRADGSFVFPAKFQLIAAMNLCPCGAMGDESKNCLCTPHAVARYRAKLSRPVQDRIDIYVELKTGDWRVLWDQAPAETSNSVRQRVIAARKFQHSRYKTAICNASVDSKTIVSNNPLDEKTQNLLQAFVEKEKASLRSIEKILRISRSIADLELADRILYHHVCEAIQYRSTQI